MFLNIIDVDVSVIIYTTFSIILLLLFSTGLISKFIVDDNISGGFLLTSKFSWWSNNPNVPVIDLVIRPEVINLLYFSN